MTRPPRDRRGRFVNWFGSVVSPPLDWREPQSESELQEIIHTAAQAGQRVRVVGSGHSWSAIAAPEQIGLTLFRYTGIVAVDRELGTVRVRGGTRLRELNRALSKLGLSLPIVGSISSQSMAGVIATGTHGSSLQHGNLSSLVKGLRLVLASGEVLDLVPRDERLDGARVHLGALGVVSEVTLPVQPSFQLAETVESLPIEQAIGSLETIARSAEYVKLWWMPYAPYALVFRYERTTDPTTRWPSPQTQRWIDDVLLQKGVYPLLVSLLSARPSLIPPFNRIVSRTLLSPRRVGPSHLMLSTPMPMRHRETEVALPMARSDEAFERVVRLIIRERFYPNFPVEVRFVRGDTGWMSPAFGSDTCQIGLYTTQLPDTDRLFAKFWRELHGLGIRPHWGKEHDRPRDELLAAYPESSRFLLLRRQLDPSGLFATDYQQRMLGT